MIMIGEKDPGFERKGDEERTRSEDTATECLQALLALYLPYMSARHKACKRWVI